jgi:hypothetical protein
MEFTHYAFSDGSRHKDGRYNSLAITTLRKEFFGSLNKQLKKILEDSGIDKEFKWKKLDSAKYRFAAEKLIDFVFKNQNALRIDILIWDLEDSRHKNLSGRDDSENLVRMYYHLVSTVLSRRWPISNSLWNWYPDQQSSVNWETLKDCISNKKHACVSDLFQQNPNFEQVNLKSPEPSESNKHPFIQLSDLFAGMGAYSFGHFDRYKKWQQQKSSQILLLPEKKHKFSNSENERFSIMEQFNKICKGCGLQIAFDTTRGFKSYVPGNFINFWLYEPQHEHDKAPRKTIC